MVLPTATDVCCTIVRMTDRLEIDELHMELQYDIFCTVSRLLGYNFFLDAGTSCKIGYKVAPLRGSARLGAFMS